MKIRNYFFFFFFITVVLSSCQQSGVDTLLLNNNWQFKQADSSNWLPADVPGCSHLDLLAHGLIDDPFFGDNEKEFQWIGETDWEYKSSFEGRDLVTRENVELVFEGLDTYADVYLNDSLILSANNMFRLWEVDIKKYINPDHNDLFVRFFSPVGIEKEQASKLPYSLPDKRGFTRKAPYQYGWDWGPTFVTSGIWKSVFLRTWKTCRIENIQIIQKTVTEEKALFSANIEIISTESINGEISVEIKEGEIELVESDINLQPGKNSITLEFEIFNPELWWPNGLGEQPLYELEFELETSNANDKRIERIGIREIELVRTPDSIGETFYFKVNGELVFMKGANYIPQDNFPSRVSDEKYRQTIQTAVDANLNMLRVWGGGIYESDIFYDLCDENGILVWQDFMFACNMYPGDQDFLESVKTEATQNVKRLRNHPSIATWCGNNEVSEGWHNWGWQKSLGYSKQDSLDVWQAYLNIFENILPNVISEYDSKRSYWPSSPSIGWGHKEAMYSGDMHYWGVWWGEEPFEVYEQKVGRFMTEFGFQGFPDLRTLDSCLMPEDKSLESVALLNHQKHPRGMELIQTYMEREYIVPDDFKNYAYVSHLVQAYGIRKALEAHRRAMPYCMGTLYWQLNDCWPVISWSSVDYYNRWKALHYFARDVFKNMAISFEEESEKLNVYIISDNFGIVNSNLHLNLISFEGDTLWNEIIPVAIESNSSKIYFEFEFAEILKDKDKSGILLAAAIRGDGPKWAHNNYYFVPPKDLNLVSPNINYDISQSQYGRYIKIKTDKLAKNVFLSIDEDGHFTNNFFDLLPNDSIEVRFISNEDSLLELKQIDNFEKRIKIKSLADTF